MPILSLMEPIIIAVAPNGARKTTKDLPQIPVTTKDIARDVKEFADAGAAMVHLHIRDKNQKHILDVEKYKETIAAIREQVGDDLIIQTTTESIGIYSPEEQMKVVMELKPDSVSLALREFIPDKSYEETARGFFADVVGSGIIPQYVLFNSEDVKYFSELRGEGIIPGKEVFVLFVLGKKTADINDKNTWSTADDLDEFLESFDGDLKLAETKWMACAFGGNENACMVKTANCGGSVRVGFENNHFLENGEVAPSNAALVEQFISSGIKRKIASAREARKILSGTVELKD